MDRLEVLVRAREFISDPARWTKGTAARDAEGHEVEPRDGCAFCIFGALRLAVNDQTLYDYYRQAADALCYDQFGQTGDGRWTALTEFNDAPETTHVDVIALFDKTIARLQK